MKTEERGLPVELGIRLVLDSVTFTNPVPPFVESEKPTYEKRRPGIAKLIEQRLASGGPVQADEVTVPGRKGKTRSWTLLSGNDQILVQTAVSAIASQVARAVDKERVFSYPFNSNPSKLRLCDPAIDTWVRFQSETQRRLAQFPALLQLDLENAYGSMKVPQLLQFAKRHSSNGKAVDLLAAMLEPLSARKPGVPFMNDSIFYLGNCYLSVVDEIVLRNHPNFIRFVDDYRLFAADQRDLEKVLVDISRQLASAGFRLNADKLKLGTGEEYLDQVAGIRFYETETIDAYTSATVYDDLVDPRLLASLVGRVITEPEKYLNEGLGRLVMNAVRRLRINDGIVKEELKYVRSPKDTFEDTLAADLAVTASAADLLDKYSKDESNEWRLIWIIFMLEDLPTAKDKTLEARIDSLIERCAQLPRAPLANLWARLYAKRHATGYLEEDVDQYGYIETGSRLLEARNA